MFFYVVPLSMKLKRPQLEEVSRLESSRKHCQLWLPDAPLLRLFSWSKWEPGEDNIDPEDDEDPGMSFGRICQTSEIILNSQSEVITGTLADNNDAIGEACRRDPDALPPRDTVNAIGSTIYHTVRALGHGNAVFAFKGGAVAGMLCLDFVYRDIEPRFSAVEPPFVPSSDSETRDQ